MSPTETAQLAQRMSAVENELSRLTAIVETTLESMTKTVDGHHEEIHGRGQGSPGLTTRVNSLETFRTGLLGVVGAAWAAIVGLAGLLWGSNK